MVEVVGVRYRDAGHIYYFDQETLNMFIVTRY